MKRPDDITCILFLTAAAVGGGLSGYDTAVISGAVELVAVRFGLDSLQQGWYVGCALVGSIAGVFCAGVLSDRFGRKYTMLLSDVPETRPDARRSRTILDKITFKITTI